MSLLAVFPLESLNDFLSASSNTPFLGLEKGWIMTAIDVIVVTILFYRLLNTVKGTRAAPMVIGVLLVVAGAVLAEFFQLEMLGWIVAAFKSVWVVAFVVLFQPELRAALARLGEGRIFHAFVRGQAYATLGEIVKAVEVLAERRHGALIVVERMVGLKNYVETGTAIEARVSAELLVTIFTPPSPLHDGAVVIRGNEVVAAGCILPLSQNPHLAGTIGTRHRAALGVSEETGAVAIVVSEESGRISIAFGRRLVRNLEPGALRGQLIAIFNPRKKPAEEENLSDEPATVPEA